MSTSSNPYVASESGTAPPPRPTPGNWIAAVVSVVLALGLLGGIAAYQKIRESRPVAEAVVQTTWHPSTVLPPRSTMDKDAFDRFRATQAGIVVSHAVLNEALRRPEIAALSAIRERHDPIDWLAKTLVVKAPADSEFMFVSLDSAAVGDAQQAVKIVNAVISQYVDYVNSKEQRLKALQADQLRSGISELEKTIQQRRREHSEIKASIGDDSPDLDALATKISNQQKILDEFQHELARMEVEFGTPSRVYLIQEAQLPEEK